MRIESIAIQDLSQKQLAAWRAIQTSNEELHTPFLTPEYARLVAEVSPGVEVSVIEDAGEFVGFLPYQRTGRGIAQPIGGSLCDYQGILLRSDVNCDARHLLDACRLRAWYFDHALASQPSTVPFQWSVADSPFLDLRDGYAAYRAAARPSCTKQIREVGRRGRKLEREVGPLRFELASTSDALLDQLILWKKDQYRRIQSVDHLTNSAIEIIRRVVNSEQSDFRGMMSALYVGDKIAAIHLGILGLGVLHSWFPAYDRELHAYSPGLLLLLHIAERSADCGFKRLDLGKGDEEYKRLLMSGATRVAVGCVDLRTAQAGLARGWFRTREWVRSSAFRRPAEYIVRSARSRLRDLRSLAAR